MKIFNRFTFDAAHRLPDWPGLHGHSYEVEVWFDGPAEDGYVMRESELARIVGAVRERLDHSYLNDIIPVPTSENIARYLWRELLPAGKLHRIRVYRPSIGLGVEYEGD